MYKLDFSKEEVVIVRLDTMECKYAKSFDYDSLCEEIDEFTQGADYELQYIGGLLKGEATKDLLMCYLVATEQDVPLWLVGTLYGNYLNITDTENVLKYQYYNIYSGNCEEEAFNEYVDSIGIIDEIPAHLQCYFDYEAYKRDLEIGGDITILDTKFYDNETYETIYIFVEGY